jgi:hypothetical protein
MQGLWVDGERPLTKKQVIDAVESGNHKVEIEELQFFGSWFSGDIADMQDGDISGCVGPDPFIARDWFCTILKEDGRVYVR